MEPTPREGKLLLSALIACPHKHLHWVRCLTPSPLLLHQVTEEVLSILRLLSPLTEPDSRSAELPPDGEKQLDAALAQLQNVARQLAISNTKQVNVQPVCNKVHRSYHSASHHRFVLQGLFPGRVCEVFAFHIPGKVIHPVSFLTHFLRGISD